MREFFKGWKRKAGIATLLTACVFMTLWVRSHLVADTIRYLPVFATSHDLTSHRGELQWSIWDRIPRKFSWQTHTIERTPDDDTVSRWPIETGWLMRTLTTDSKTPKRGRVIIIQYWCLTIPLTLLSACLLFSKPPALKRSPEPMTTRN
jgi:hypothetical protein